MTTALAPGQRLGRLEDPGRDFPFDNGAPVGLSAWQWVFVLTAVVVGFAVLVAPIPWPAGPLGAVAAPAFAHDAAASEQGSGVSRRRG
jgi:hypothetical protein